MSKSRFTDWIVHEDDDYLFVNKPPFLSVLEDRSSPQHLLQLARVYHSEAQACHRIDKETSGLVLFSKNNEAYKKATILFETRKIEKYYHAVCEHPTEFHDHLINLPISSTSKGRSFISHAEGKASTTLVNTLQSYKHYSLLLCEPHTGRLHQIRVHLAASNHPLVADVLYGGQFPFLSTLKRKFHLSKGREESPIIKRVALHARGLKFSTDKSYDVSAPYPNDFEALINILNKYDV